MGIIPPILSHTEPSHTRVLQWREVVFKMKRFEQLCSNLVLRLLQRLVMKAITTLECGIRKTFRDSVACIKRQMEAFQKMREEVSRQPFTQSVMDRLEFSQQDSEEDSELLALQASSFCALLSNVDLGKHPNYTSWESFYYVMCIRNVCVAGYLRLLFRR